MGAIPEKNRKRFQIFFIGVLISYDSNDIFLFYNNELTNLKFFMYYINTKMVAF